MTGDGTSGNAKGSGRALQVARQPLRNVLPDAVTQSSLRSADVPASTSTHEGIDHIMLEQSGESVLGGSNGNATSFKNHKRSGCRKKRETQAQGTSNKGSRLVTDERDFQNNRLLLGTKRLGNTFFHNHVKVKKKGGITVFQQKLANKTQFGIQTFRRADLNRAMDGTLNKRNFVTPRDKTVKAAVQACPGFLAEQR